MTRCYKIAAVLLFSAVLFLINCVSVFAAPLSNVPQEITEPDGTVVHCFASGDENFHYLHDKDGNILMLNSAGYVVFAAKDEDGIPIATENLFAEGNTQCEKISISDVDVKKASENSVYKKTIPLQEKNTEASVSTTNTGAAVASDNSAAVYTDKTVPEIQAYAAEEPAKTTRQLVNTQSNEQCDNIKTALFVSLIVIIVGMMLFYIVKGKRKKMLSIVLAFLLFAGNAGFSQPVSAANTATGIFGTMTNLVIYIYFSDETSDLLSQNGTTFENYLNGSGNSLQNYYETISGGQFSIHSFTAKNSDSTVFYYKDNKPRNYYQELSDTNPLGYDVDKNEDALRERELLTASITAVQDKFSAASGLNLDVMEDGYIDSVTFVVNGNPSPWSALLWPHSWNFYSLNYYADQYDYPTINGIPVNNFNLQLSTMFTSGVLCHEISHVLGAPDLYDYTYEYDFVGPWDLMSATSDTPQYLLAYMREKYFGWVGSGQIRTISSGGSYTLSKTTSVTPFSSGVTALCLPLGDSDEKIYIEYRDKNTSGGYDSQLSGSGLIVYRTRSDMVGNSYATPRYQEYADLPEVFVYRPLIYTRYNEIYNPLTEKTNRFYQRTAQDVQNAWLSSDNSNFKTLGKSMNTATNPYDPATVYLTDGINLGLILSGITKNANGTISFTVTASDVPDYSQYFAAGEVPFSELSPKVPTNFTYSAVNPAGIRSVKADLLDSNGSVVLENTGVTDTIKQKIALGAGTLTVDFLYKNRSSANTTLWNYGKPVSFEKPVKAILYIKDLLGRTVSVTKALSITDTSWGTFKNSYQVTQNAQYAFTDFMPYMLRNDGTGTISQVCYTDDENFSSALDAWTGIKAISAGSQHIAGITADGSVNFTNIFDLSSTQTFTYPYPVSKISSAAFHSVMLLSDGTVRTYSGGSYGKSELANWSDITDVKAATYFTAGLKSDGTVVLAGYYGDYGIDVSSWTNIKSIEVTDSSILGIRQDGTVVASGILFSSLPETLTNITAAATQEFTLGDVPVQCYWLLRDDGALLLFNSLNGAVEAEPVEKVAEVSCSNGYITATLENGDTYGVNYYFNGGWGFEDAYYVKKAALTRISSRTGSVSGANLFNVDTNFYPLAAASQTVAFTSSNQATATVNSTTGDVTFLKQGEVIITATSGGATDKVKLSYNGSKVQKVLYSDSLSINQQKGFIYSAGILTQFALKTKIGFGTELKLDEYDTDLAYTDLSVSYLDDLGTPLKYVLLGDSDGDGIVSMYDCISVKNGLLQKSILTGAFLEASDINTDGSGNIVDLLILKDIALEKSAAEQPAYTISIAIEPQVAGTPANLTLKINRHLFQNAFVNR